MRPFLYTLFVIVTVKQTLFAQTPVIQWQKCLGGNASDYTGLTQLTVDGGYIVAGTSESNSGNASGNHGNFDIWVVKLTSTGTVSWQRCLGGSANEYVYSIGLTADGGYIVAGLTSSNNGDVSGNHGAVDVWVVKLSSTGAVQWQKCLGGTESEYAYSIQPTADGGYILAGLTSSADEDVSGNHGSTDAWVVKVSSTGNIQWQKCLGGSANEYAYSIQQTADGGYILAGTTESTNGDVSGNHGDFDVWVVKLSSTGAVQWRKCLGGSADEYAYSIRQIADGNYVLACTTESNNGDVSGNHGNSDIWVVKLNSTGSILWRNCLGGNAGEYAYAIELTADGGYVVAGTTESSTGDVSGNHGAADVWVVKLSSTGVIEWQKCLGGSASEYAYSIGTTTDEGYILAGFTSSGDGNVSSNHGSSDIWVVRLGPPGKSKADITLSLNASAHVATVNVPITYTLQLRNQSESSVDEQVAVTWENRLPPNLQFEGGSGVTHTSGVVSGTVVNLAGGSEITFTYRLKPTVAGIYQNAAQIVTASNPDPDSQPGSGTGDGEDDAAMADIRTAEAGSVVFSSANPNQLPLPGVIGNQPLTEPTKADLELSMRVSNLTPKPNQIVSYTLSVSNRGRIGATGVQLAGLLPAGLTFVDGMGWSASGSILTDMVNSVAAGATVDTIFRVRVTGSGQLTTQAQISASSVAEADSTPNNGYTNGEDDTAQVSIRVN